MTEGSQVSDKSNIYRYSIEYLAQSSLDRAAKLFGVNADDLATVCCTKTVQVVRRFTITIYF